MNEISQNHDEKEPLNAQVQADEGQTSKDKENLEGARVPSKGKKPKKKRSFFLTLIAVLFGIILVFIGAIGLFAAYSALDGADPSEHIPEGYYAYINLPSASAFINQTLSTLTLDSILAGAGMGDVQGLLRSFRASPIPANKWFKFAANVRIDAAAYSSGDYTVLIKLGFRSCVLRLLPAVLKIHPDLLNSVNGLKAESDDGIDYWVYTAKGSPSVFIGRCKDILICSTSPSLFFASMQKNRPENFKTIKKFIKNARSGSLSVLSDINHFKDGFTDGSSVAANVASRINFPEYSAVNIALQYDDITVSGSGAWESSDEGLKTILTKRSFVPGILSRLPKSAGYITLVNMGEPEFLLKNGSQLLTPSMLKAYKAAEDGTRFAFNKDLNELLFSWMGSEMGVFGTEQSASPVIFVSLKNEKKCKEVFQDIFASAFINQDVSAVVNGMRVPRIEFPSLLKSLLRSFGIELPTPFYIIKDGYLYLSQSAEVLAAAIQEASKGDLLVRTENWKTVMRSVSAESSLFVYYTFEESIPSFLKSNAMLKTILKDYGKGVFSIKLDSKQTLGFDLYLQKTKSHSLSELASFPYQSPVKVGQTVYAGKNASNVPFLYWASDSSVYAFNLADRSIQSLKLDDSAYVNVQTERGFVRAVWAVSARGSVYKTDYALNAASGFPVLTGEKCASEPQFLKDGIVVPSANKEVLLFVSGDGTVSYSDEMNAKLKNPPAVYRDVIAAVPRSFDSSIYLFTPEGKTAPAYPAELDSICAVRPVLYENDKKELWYAVATEDGIFSLKPCFASESSGAEGFSVNLYASCKVQPVYSPILKMFFVITDRSYLYKIDTQAQIVGQVALKQKDADDYVLTLIDADGNGRDDVLVSGGGNALYAYTDDLQALDGFPVAGTGTPRLIDVDGDGFAELISCGIDNKIHAYDRGSK